MLASANRAVDAAMAVEVFLDDGSAVEPGDEVLRVRGDGASILAAERTVLNFLQQAGGIASLTRRFVAAVEGTGARILETRKTPPGLRDLAKQAVRLGGGVNHRIGLFDQVLLKENHFAAAAPDSIETVVARAVRQSPGGAPVIAEARDVTEAEAAVRGGARVVLLDNFAPDERLAAAIERVRAVAAEVGNPIEVEVSGGIGLHNVRAFAEQGVDRISIGALTHSAAALDLSMLVEMSEPSETEGDAADGSVLEFRVRPEPAEVRALRHGVRERLEGIGVAEERIDSLVLVLDEIVNNSIEHGAGYRTDADVLEVRVAVGSARIDVEYRDPSVPADVVSELVEMFAEVRSGPPPAMFERGRGLFLIQDGLADLAVESVDGGMRLSGHLER